MGTAIVENWTNAEGDTIQLQSNLDNYSRRGELSKAGYRISNAYTTDVEGQSALYVAGHPELSTTTAVADQARAIDKVSPTTKTFFSVKNIERVLTKRALRGDRFNLGSGGLTSKEMGLRIVNRVAAANGQPPPFPDVDTPPLEDDPNEQDDGYIPPKPPTITAPTAAGVFLAIAALIVFALLLGTSSGWAWEA
jgi:hypothetical protein